VQWWVTLHIIGKGANEQQQKAFAAYRNVTPRRDSSTTFAHVLAAEVSIAPMVSGSGIKNKIPEPRGWVVRSWRHHWQPTACGQRPKSKFRRGWAAALRRRCSFPVE
jgi:hypothetical protein